MKKWRQKIYLKFSHGKTEEWRPAEKVKIKSEDCILKCEDPKIISCWLDPQIILDSRLLLECERKAGKPIDWQSVVVAWLLEAYSLALTELPSPPIIMCFWENLYKKYLRKLVWPVFQSICKIDITYHGSILEGEEPRLQENLRD